MCDWLTDRPRSRLSDLLTDRSFVYRHSTSCLTTVTRKLEGQLSSTAQFVQFITPSVSGVSNIRIVGSCFTALPLISFELHNVARVSFEESFFKYFWYGLKVCRICYPQVITHNIRQQRYEGWNFNFGNTPLDCTRTAGVTRQCSRKDGSFPYLHT